MIKPFEYINIYTNNPCDYANFLVENYFLVPEDFNETELTDLFKERQRLPITSNYLDHPSKFVILTTTKCNARCFYCYELNSKGKTHMTYETAEKVAEYIMNVAPKNTEVQLNWFGGEPLFNSDVIEIICSRLASAKIKYSSAMISNSYLFTPEMIRKAKYEWNLTNVQVTFDGTEEVYNKIKNYIYKDQEVSPYQTVINNVKNMLEAGIRISVRMNCDQHNFENLKELIKELHEHFKDYGNFSMYAWPLFEIGFKRTDEEKEILYKSVLELEKMIQDLDYPSSHCLPDGIKGVHCMVDGGDTVTINPKGDLGMCEHYIDDLFVGHIDTPYKKDFNVIRKWREYVDHTELCNDCPVYPSCIKMKGCPDEVPCDIYQKNYWLEHYKLSLISDFKLFKAEDLKKQENRCNKKCEKDSCNKPNNEKCV
jgi:sulfatase maturation enzyme AslB (radical SAM superfamily)